MAQQESTESQRPIKVDEHKLGKEIGSQIHREERDKARFAAFMRFCVTLLLLLGATIAVDLCLEAIPTHWFEIGGYVLGGVAALSLLVSCFAAAAKKIEMSFWTGAIGTLLAAIAIKYVEWGPVTEWFGFN